jgi:hypothetical protein
LRIYDHFQGKMLMKLSSRPSQRSLLSGSKTVALHTTPVLPGAARHRLWDKPAALHVNGNLPNLDQRHCAQQHVEQPERHLTAAVPARCWQQKIQQHLPKALCVAAAVAALSLAAPQVAHAAAAATSGGDSLLKSECVYACMRFGPNQQSQ